VVTTDVGGNAEVVARPELGTVVPFDDAPALQQALSDALLRQWDGDAIIAYARDNGWDKRIDRLCELFTCAAKQGAIAGRPLPQAEGR
jgi:glycosyltransferase involved in cell wall biosynthesis